MRKLDSKLVCATCGEITKFKMQFTQSYIEFAAKSLKSELPLIISSLYNNVCPKNVIAWIDAYLKCSS